MDDSENGVPPGPSFTFDAHDHLIKNRGGRPRKDGTRADNSTTLKEMGISKRDAARMRFYASFPEDVFEAALKKHIDAMKAHKRVPSMTSLLKEYRKDNNRHERETKANIARIISTARNILKAHEFDCSDEGAALRRLAEVTIELWTMMRLGDDTS